MGAVRQAQARRVRHAWAERGRRREKSAHPLRADGRADAAVGRLRSVTVRFEGVRVTVCNKRWGRFRTGPLSASCEYERGEVCLLLARRSICLLSTSTRECMVSIRGISDDPNGSLVSNVAMAAPRKEGGGEVRERRVTILHRTEYHQFRKRISCDTIKPNSQSNHTIGRITRLGRTRGKVLDYTRRFGGFYVATV